MSVLAGGILLSLFTENPDGETKFISVVLDINDYHKNSQSFVKKCKLPKGFKKENYTLIHTCKTHKKYQIDFFSIDDRMDSLKDGLYGWTAPKMKPFRLLAPQHIRKKVLAVLITRSSNGIRLKDVEDNLQINLDTAYYSTGTEKDYYIDNSSDIETQQGSEESEDHWDIKEDDSNKTKYNSDVEVTKKDIVEKRRPTVIRLAQPDQKDLSTKIIKSTISQETTLIDNSTKKNEDSDSSLESNIKETKKRTYSDSQNINLEQQIKYLKEDNYNMTIKVMEIEEKLKLERQNLSKLEFQIHDDRILICQLGEVLKHMTRDQDVGEDVKKPIHFQNDHIKDYEFKGETTVYLIGEEPNTLWVDEYFITNKQYINDYWEKMLNKIESY